MTGTTGVFELSALTTATGMVINGIAVDDNAGYSLAGAEDINGRWQRWYHDWGAWSEPWWTR